MINIDAEAVEELAARGLTNGQISDHLGVHRATLQRRIADTATIATAIKKGRARGVETIANALFEKALGGNVTAQIFFLKTRAGWSENGDYEDEDEDDPFDDPDGL